LADIKTHTATRNLLPDEHALEGYPSKSPEPCSMEAVWSSSVHYALTYFQYYQFVTNTL
jgi:hypothetical protein